MGGYSRERKHLIFKKQVRAKGAKTDKWHVVNGESQFLAIVVYRPGWRRYVLRILPGGTIIDFDGSCLGEAKEFCVKETALLKLTWKKRKVRGLTNNDSIV